MNEFFEFEEETVPKRIKYTPMNEGVDHINIYSRSKYEVGRQLSNFYRSPFVSSEYNTKFTSVEGFWYWLKTGKVHDELKNLHGVEAKNVGRKYSKVKIDNFNDSIKTAILDKLEQNPIILKNLCDTSLPLTHYYYYGEITNPRIHDFHDKYHWIIELFEEIRIKLK